MPGLDLSLQVIGDSVRANRLPWHWEATVNAGVLDLSSVFCSGQQITSMFIQCYSAAGGREIVFSFILESITVWYKRDYYILQSCFSCLSRDKTVRGRVGQSSKSLAMSRNYCCWTELQNRMSQSFLPFITDYHLLYMCSRCCHLTKTVPLQEISEFLYISELPNQEHVLR